ncbi:MAG TPA: hypothetical protein VKE98_14455 [Gemmataceae bacterium]|nr:hypothetical protein [Gemmataceae bacterium]
MKSKWIASVLFLVPLWSLTAGDDRPKTNADKEKFAELSKLIQKIALKQVPNYIQDNTGWGQTVPIPGKLRFPNLRTTVKVKDRLELPHGVWRKVKVSLNEPAKDLTVRVREFKVDGKTIRISLDAVVTAQTEIEAEHWQLGLFLWGFKGKAGPTIGVNVDCDVAIAPGKSLLEVKVEPKVTSLKVDLKDLNLREITTARLGKVAEGENAKALGNRYKEVLQEAIDYFKPTLEDYANQAIAQSLKEGRGTISLTELMKFTNSAKEKK